MKTLEQDSILDLARASQLELPVSLVDELPSSGLLCQSLRDHGCSGLPASLQLPDGLRLAILLHLARVHLERPHDFDAELAKLQDSLLRLAD